MKRKLLMLTLAGTLAFSTTTSFAMEAPLTDETAIEAQTTEEGIEPLAETTTNTVTAEEAVAAVGNKEVVIVDVRSATNYSAGHLKNSISLPLFPEEGQINPDDYTDFLSVAFKDSIPALGGKKVYILCNSGSRGAQKATDLLLANGYDNSKVFTITGGYKNEVIQNNAYRYADINTAVAAKDNGSAVLLDVRAHDKYVESHIPGSVWFSVFNADVASQVQNYAKRELIPSGKDVYLLCNTGNTLAERATQQLRAAGMDRNKIFTITGGATNTSALTASGYEALTVTDQQAVDAIGNDGVLIVDVRSAQKYAAGHLKGSLSLPLFTDEGTIPDGVEDPLSAAFKEAVNAELGKFMKPVYILCNSGSRGAVKATQILTSLGFSDVYTITNGAKSELIQSKFVTTDSESTPAPTPVPTPVPTPTPAPAPAPTNPAPANPAPGKAPLTGDASAALPYAAMAGAAVVTLLERKKLK